MAGVAPDGTGQVRVNSFFAGDLGKRISAVAGFFANLTPLFTAIFSAAFLGELHHLYHVAAFALIVGGIVVTARQ